MARTSSFSLMSALYELDSDFVSTSSLTQQTAGRHVTLFIYSETLYWLRAIQFLLILLKAAYSAEQQQILIPKVLVWPYRVSWSTVLEVIMSIKPRGQLHVGEIPDSYYLWWKTCLSHNNINFLENQWKCRISMQIYIKYNNKFSCFLMWRYNDVSFATFPNPWYTYYHWYALLEMVFSPHLTS